MRKRQTPASVTVETPEMRDQHDKRQRQEGEFSLLVDLLVGLQTNRWASFYDLHGDLADRARALWAEFHPAEDLDHEDWRRP